MRRHVEKEPEPWAGLRRSLVALLDAVRKKSEAPASDNGKRVTGKDGKRN